MKLYIDAGCVSCHHEWQAVGSPGRCSWCGGEGVELGQVGAWDWIESENERVNDEIV